MNAQFAVKLVVAGALATAAIGLHAQTYPAKTIRYVVPFPAGGTTDVLGRIIGVKLSEAWGQQVIIDNRPGAGGGVGSEIAAKAPPDGYTLLGGTISSHSINISLYSRLGYHPLRDFAPVTRLVMVANVLTVHPSLPVRTVKEFTALAKARPGQLRYGSAGAGTSQHLSGELFDMMAGTKMVHVPYKGGVAAMTDLMGGQIELAFENAPNAVPHIKAGKLRAIGVTTATRTGALPEVPTLAEAGVPGYEVASWQGLFTPAGTSGAIVGKLNAEVRRIIQLPDVREKLAVLGADVSVTSPEEFVEFIRGEIAKWARVVKASGARAD